MFNIHFFEWLYIFFLYGYYLQILHIIYGQKIVTELQDKYIQNNKKKKVLKSILLKIKHNTLSKKK